MFTVLNKLILGEYESEESFAVGLFWLSKYNEVVKLHNYYNEF